MRKLRNLFRLVGWGFNRESARWISSGGGTVQTAIRLSSESSARFVLENLTVGQLFETRSELHDFAISKFPNLPEGLYMEFGVWKGGTLRKFAGATSNNNTIYGFDSFEGLVNPWSYPGHGLESFNLEGQIPENVKNIPGVEIILGRVEKTLRPFLSNQDKKISFVHIDLDVYEPVAHVLKEIKNYVQPGTLIVFDELIGYPGWENHEKKAIDEYFSELSYEWVAFSDLQAIMRIK
jgi:hypothetical protein